MAKISTESALSQSTIITSEKRKKHAVVPKKKTSRLTASLSLRSHKRYKPNKDIKIDKTITIVLMSIVKKKANRAANKKDVIAVFETIFRAAGDKLACIILADDYLNDIERVRSGHFILA